LRVSAVSYLNTWPLVWGFLYGPQKGLFDFRFDLPADCAAAVGSGAADIGLVPCAELDRLGLDFLPDLGIACEGPVRSILLFSRRPFREIRTLAADSSSRSSVALARILLAERYGAKPAIVTHPPALDRMLDECDAAVIIGDPALRLDATALPYLSLDLGAEWVLWTGLPMVFAVWAGQKRCLTPQVSATFRASYEWGRGRTEEMIGQAVDKRGFSEDIARDYFTKRIVCELSARHREGLAMFRSLLRALEPAVV
jgi:predicted solute-binding protein